MEEARRLSGQTNTPFGLRPDGRRQETVWRSRADRDAAALWIKIIAFAVKLEAAAEPDESPEVDYFPDHHFLPVRLSSSPRLIVPSPLMRERSPRCKELKGVVGDVRPHLNLFFLFFTSWPILGALPLLELLRTVTHDDNVTVIRLYLDE